MTAWLALAGAIGSEVVATLSLRVAAHGARRWYAVVVAGYLAAFALLSVSLAHGMPLGVAYGVWTATGVAVTAVASRLLFDEPLTPVMAAGIALIAGGVLLVELGAH
ncbi:SMR family transporter [Aeromicrobium sp. IC_218]|uniref:DMT family transporter n=1 Tax=Aeromicrobium sp. IC_218 TaxID=2545468 RepID=UPI00103A36F6|nr:SMR family transporter [Aeromicrobium sp. IC_218]TCJ00857.1 QacE family quaternary ammonium compound efflux SMR transporter [Aeromicrobium sp. IC_218]